VNAQMQTSDPDIYAVGDAIEVLHMVSGKPTTLALAGPASRQGRTAADNIAGRERRFPGVQGSSVVKVFDLTVASTGLNSRQLETLGLPFKSVTTHNNNHAEYYPGSASITLKLLYSPDGKIYGAQAVGAAGTEKRIDVIATAMRGKLSVYDLEDLELCYAPPFGSSRDPVNISGFTAGNELRGDVPTLQWSDVAGLDPQSWTLLDVRQPEELAIGRVPGAINIPLAELRARTAELPRDKKILVNCARGKRSYYALRALRQLGFDAWNLSGGYTTYHSATAPLPEPVSKVSPRPVQESIGSNKSVSKEVHSGQSYTLDACGLQCPGPILRLYNKMNSMEQGDEVTVTATDFGFASDVAAWARSTGNTLKALDTRDGKVIAVLRKGLESAEDAPAVPAADKKGLTMVVFSGDLDKAIAAFIIANGFASMGQKATLFFTFWGLNILRKDEPVAVKKTLIEKMFGWMMPRGAKKLSLSQMHMLGMGTGMIKDIMKKKNVDSLPVLIREAQANGVKLIACQMTMDLMGIHQEELIEGVEIGGVATMAASATESNTHYFI
jgi:peroxiredoxin family protein/rhodanese-related sulfurtransferase/TusA-related sulfurtransferase